MFNRLKKAWSFFRGRDPTLKEDSYYDYSGPNSWISGQPYYSFVNRQSLVTSVYNRIATDVSMIDIKHVRLRRDNSSIGDRQYESTINDSLNEVLTTSANIDQTGTDIIKELALTLFDRGCAALVPTYSDVDPEKNESFRVIEMRVGTIMEWYPRKIRVDLYNDITGEHEQIDLDKRVACIIYNPFKEVMNERNGTAQRLMNLTRQIERTNGTVSSGKLDLIFQLPYAINTEAKEKQAAKRKKSIEDQLEGSPLGIAYVDATERVIQLNRSLENNLWQQYKDLQEEFFNQLGVTKAILDGTADENERLNYYHNTIEPILCAICEEIERKWISQTARSQGQAIMYFRNPFKLIPVNEVAQYAETLTRNEIMSSNEYRSVLGLMPVNDPKADELRNSNLNQPYSDSSNTKLSIDEIANQINVDDLLNNK